ncbi:MAG: SapC family protein [Colwellia sp.]|nr:SapC family protein [Colwellia sp.]
MTYQKENFQPLNSTDHANLRVKNISDCGHLKNCNNSVIIAEEITDIAANCPVVLLKDEESGRFQLSALFGLTPSENLFINESGQWLGTYIPVNFNIKPFSTSFDDSNNEKSLVIDVNSPAISTESGVKLFEGNAESSYLIKMRQQVEMIIDATVQTEKLIQELVNRNLLCEFKLIIEGLTEQPEIIEGLYTINADEFPYLTSDDVFQFHQMNYWGVIYAMQNSMKQFKKLVQIRNARYQDSKIKLTIHMDKESD